MFFPLKNNIGGDSVFHEQSLFQRRPAATPIATIRKKKVKFGLLKKMKRSIVRKEKVEREKKWEKDLISYLIY